MMLLKAGGVATAFLVGGLLLGFVMAAVDIVAEELRNRRRRRTRWQRQRDALARAHSAGIRRIG